MYSDYDQLATPSDAIREFTHNVGRDNAQRAWILTPYDTWEANPFYHGPKVSHPESDDPWEHEPLYSPAAFPNVFDFDDIPF